MPSTNFSPYRYPEEGDILIKRAGRGVTGLDYLEVDQEWHPAVSLERDLPQEKDAICVVVNVAKGYIRDDFGMRGDLQDLLYLVTPIGLGWYQFSRNAFRWEQ